MKSKLLLALKCFLNSWRRSHNYCANCPFGYAVAIDDGSNEPPYVCDDLRLFNDVYQYLEATSQHLLSKDEVREKALKGAPLWFEPLDNSPLTCGWVLSKIYPPFINEVYLRDNNARLHWYNLKTYGKTWRCWAQPLDKETDVDLEQRGTN